MSERFTEDQVQRIFARAARRQHATATPDGLSRADLEAIAREVGLDPALVAEAIEAERVEDASDDGRRVRVLSSDVTDREWESIVDLLRAKAGGPGVAQQVGRRREWTSPGPTVGGVAIASVELTPTEEGTVLAVVPRKSGTSPKTSARLLAGVLALNALIYGSIFIGNDKPIAALVMTAVSLLLAVACLIGVPILARRRATATQDQIDGLLDRIDLLSRADDDRPRGRIDLDALDGVLEDESERPRGRVRS